MENNQEKQTPGIKLDIDTLEQVGGGASARQNRGNNIHKYNGEVDRDIKQQKKGIGR